MFTALLPKSAPFFELLLKQNQLLCTMTASLVELLDNYSSTTEIHHRIASLEDEADKLFAEITIHLSQTFITPIDREDILHINKEQEEAIDILHGTANRLYIFELSRVRFPMLQLARNLDAMARVTGSMLEGLTKRKDTHETRHFISLSTEGEMLLSMGIVELHDVPATLSMQDLLTIMKYQQVYDRLEHVLRQIKQLGETIEEAVLKNV